MLIFKTHKDAIKNFNKLKAKQAKLEIKYYHLPYLNFNEISDYYIEVQDLALKYNKFLDKFINCLEVEEFGLGCTNENNMNRLMNRILEYINEHYENIKGLGAKNED